MNSIRTVLQTHTQTDKLTQRVKVSSHTFLNLIKALHSQLKFESDFKCVNCISLTHTVEKLPLYVHTKMTHVLLLKPNY